ncbi:MAG: ATP-binding protein [Saprospiraceae bacterium]|nr:ATP-binding protein [Saprospiraceae bacterium]
MQSSTSLRLPSNPKYVSAVEPYVERLVKSCVSCPDKYGDILISITEAVTNAIVHGNTNDESKIVRVSFKKDADKVAFSVTDEGRGFDPASVPDPTCPENLLKVGGRGVFLMKELSDNINFRNGGSTVELQFKVR